MSTKKPDDLKAARVAKQVTRAQLAMAAGISAYMIDRIERGVDVSDDAVKAYHAGMIKFPDKPATEPKKATPAKAAPAKALHKPAAAKATPAKATATKPRNRTARKTAKASTDAKPEPKADEPKAEEMAA
jgi:DNA-binding XRE family transcriptional regulator